MARLLMALAALGVIVAPGAARAAIQVAGEPVGSDGWTQAFRESGVGTFDFVAVKIVSPEGEFAAPGLGGFNRARWSAEGVGSSEVIAAAHGPQVGDMTFEIAFSGPSSDPLAMVFVAFREGSLLEESKVEWDGNAWIGAPAFPSTQEWSLGNSDWGPADILAEGGNPNPTMLPPIPEPVSVTIWGVLVGLVTTFGWWRRRRAV